MKYSSDKKAHAHSQAQHHYENPESHLRGVSSSSVVSVGPGVQYTDWKIALGELSLNLRREMSDKAGREEMISVIAAELEPLGHKLQVCEN